MLLTILFLTPPPLPSLSLSPNCSGGSEGSTKSTSAMLETNSTDSNPSLSMPSSPSSGMLELASEDGESSKIGDDVTDTPNLPDSPPLTNSTMEEPDYSKMSMYSPSTQEQFSVVPENLASEAQSSLQTVAPEVQGAKSYVPGVASDFAVSSHSDMTTNYCSIAPLTSNGYPHTQPSGSPTSLPTQLPYPVSYNTAFGDALGLSSYPTSGYLSPYGSKQYSWPVTPSGVSYPGAAFGMNTHDLTQPCYPYPVGSSGAYSQVSVSRATYPTGYVPAQLTTVTTQNC